MSLCQDILERLNLLFLGFSAGGWLLFIVAFGSQQTSFDPVINAASFLFVPWWFAAIAGPILYVLIGLHILIGLRYRAGEIFRSVAAAVSFIYIGALAAPLFTVSTIGLAALSLLNEVLDSLEIPDLRAIIDLGIFNFLLDIINDVVALFQNAIRGIIYVFLVFVFNFYFTAVKSQVVGSLSSIFFLCLSMMLWPFMEKKKHPKMCKKCY